MASLQEVRIDRLTGAQLPAETNEIDGIDFGELFMVWFCSCNPRFTEAGMPVVARTELGELVTGVKREDPELSRAKKKMTQRTGMTLRNARDFGFADEPWNKQFGEAYELMELAHWLMDRRTLNVGLMMVFGLGSDLE